MNNKYKLYGAEFSLYSGKVRSYLRKKGIPFEEINPSLKVYKNFIIPRTGVKYIPVVQTPDDMVLQDTTVIIDELETHFPDQSVYPTTPKQKLVSLLLEVYGDEWLVIPAMHYRWFYEKENYKFLISEFGGMIMPKLPKFMQRSVGKKAAKQFQGAVAWLGVREHNWKTVEESYEQLLQDLQIHFSEHDYLLGGRPSIADFGFIGPFYAHLYRDPYPGKLMREKAPAVVKWVERMIGDAPATGDFLENDKIPETLLPILQRMAREQVPVLEDANALLKVWSEKNSDIKELPRHIGKHNFTLGGVESERAVLPYSLWLFQRPHDFYQNLSAEQKQVLSQLLQSTGFTDILNTPLQTRIERRDNKLFV